MGKTAGRAVSSADLLRDRKKCMFSEEILYIYYRSEDYTFPAALICRSLLPSEARLHPVRYKKASHTISAAHF